MIVSPLGILLHWSITKKLPVGVRSNLFYLLPKSFLLKICIIDIFRRCTIFIFKLFTIETVQH